MLTDPRVWTSFMKPQDVDDDEGRQTADYNNTRGDGRRRGPKLAFVESSDLLGDTAAAAAMVIGEQIRGFIRKLSLLNPRS